VVLTETAYVPAKEEQDEEEDEDGGGDSEEEPEFVEGKAEVQHAGGDNSVEERRLAMEERKTLLEERRLEEQRFNQSINQSIRRGLE